MRKKNLYQKSARKILVKLTPAYFNQFGVYLTIVAKAKAYLARIVNYNHKVCCKLKRAFRIVTHF